jgi:hypothetical protein
VSVSGERRGGRSCTLLRVFPPNGTLHRNDQALSSPLWNQDGFDEIQRGEIQRTNKTRVLHAAIHHISAWSQSVLPDRIRLQHSYLGPVFPASTPTGSPGKDEPKGLGHVDSIDRSTIPYPNAQKNRAASAGLERQTCLCESGLLQAMHD